MNALLVLQVYFRCSKRLASCSFSF